jgi:type 1 glutamine amidotransferase
MTGGVLFVTEAAPYAHGPAGVHGVLGQASRAMAQLADRHDLAAWHTDDVRSLDPDSLARASVLALFTIGETRWSDAQRTEILDRLRSGELGVLSIHSATDACYGWPEYASIVGARFDGHPWTQSFRAEVVDASHPAVAHVAPVWMWHDEVYQFAGLRADARVLLRVNEDDIDGSAPGARRPEFGYPLAWCHEEGSGRVFSTSLGHFPAAWESPAYLRHLDGGLEWLLGEGS